ncbi:two-component response regulator protein [Desulforapulum autotrophicum HRM2]|uniref:Two-component response regulator protein n=1 Tax=Desulforapulum autotrophicum (strain ATCC 43914 / DSM 3382 / VKM B-1955 / HRM2) TaxID=177437 RepID=C0QJ84_DESAH|nr:response regulator transcription factor [Desulforapulum autotrophicum]ACN15897.1 two-component response regulator protein [Desulforapulum autotrophicum HRM2]
MNQNPITILLVDDHDILRQSLKKALEEKPNVKVLQGACNGLDAVRLTEKHCPNIVIMDINMPDLNGIEAAKQIISKNPDIKIIALSMLCDEFNVKSMIQAGAKGFLLKTSSLEDLHTAILMVASGKSYLCPEALNIMMEDIQTPGDTKLLCPLQRLTLRERGVIQLIAEGYTSQEISEKLNISKRTVDVHRTNTMNKLKIHTIAGLTRFAVKEGLITL